MRGLGIAAGVANHGLFALTVYFLIGFLAGTRRPETNPNGYLAPATVAWDMMLAVQFGAIHSWLLLPSVRRAIARWMPDAFHGTLFCSVTCGSLLLTMFAWRPSGIVLAEATGWGRVAVQAAYVGSWGLLLYSIGLNGFGYQTGFTPWLHWLRGERPPRREFRPTSLYLWLRHPIYLGFLGLIWFAPIVTADRLLLNVLWTGYVYAGSVLKDRRLLYYLGDEYREYQERVPGYPGIWWGPLARRPHVGGVRSESPAT